MPDFRVKKKGAKMKVISSAKFALCLFFSCIFSFLLCSCSYIRQYQARPNEQDFGPESLYVESRPLANRGVS